MARKRRKLKRCSCHMCKPHKMQWGCRWKPREEAAIRESEQYHQEYTRAEE